MLFLAVTFTRKEKKIRFVFISFIRLPILKPLATMTHISAITLYYAVSGLLPVLSSSALGFVSIKPGNLQLYLKTTCLTGSVHNTLVSSLEVIPWRLHLRLLAICPRLKGNFSGSVQRSVCPFQSRYLFSNHLWWNHFCASLACYVPTCPVRDSQHYFCSLCATELHAETTAQWGEWPSGSSPAQLPLLTI